MGYKKYKALLPIVAILGLAVFLRSSTYLNHPKADESKFYQYAINLTDGFYYDVSNPLIKEGPGYPMFLAMPVGLGIPLFAIRAFNIVFLSIACLYLFMILNRYISHKSSIVLTYLFALYPPMLRWANLMYAESFEIMLLLAFIFHFIKWYHREGNRRLHLVLAILFSGYLILTKIIFAYVFGAALIIVGVLMLIPGISREFRLSRVFIVFAGALVVLSPYVIYNYYNTGKFFYLGTHGGSILYHRATPFENEFGNHFSEEKVLAGEGPSSRSEVNVNLTDLQKNHLELYQQLDGLTWMQKDSVLKSVAIENMKKHPVKYLKNTAANFSRLIFHFPFSYRIQNLETLGYLVPNMFIVVLCIFGLWPAIARRNLIPRELLLILFLAVVYLGGHTLLGGRGRFFIPAVPMLLIFFSFVYLNILDIKFRRPDDS